MAATVLVGALGSAALTACADPGAEALDALVAEAEDLVSRIERGPIAPAELAAWADRVGPALVDRAREEARMLGPARRAELEARWRAASERLVARLRARSSDR